MSFTSFRYLAICACAFLLCSAGLSILPRTATAAEGPIRLRYANFPPASTFPCVQMERWIDEVERATGGKVKVDSFPGGALLDARSMVRGVLRGQADIGCTSLAYSPGVYPLMSAFELPLGFRSAEKASAALLQIIRDFDPKELASVKVLTAFTSPPSQIMSRKPVQSLADIKGLNLRAAGILADEVALLGGNPVSMPQSEAPDAIQRGTVDGIFSSLDVAKDLNFAETCRYGLLPDMSLYPFVVIMNRKTWDALPADVRTALDDLAMPHAVLTGKYVDDHAREALDWGRRTYNIKYLPLDDAQRAEALRLVSPLVDAWKEKTAAAGLPAEQVLDAIRKAQQLP